MRSVRSHLPNLQVAHNLRVCPCRESVSFAGRFSDFNLFAANCRVRHQFWDCKIWKQGHNLQKNVACPKSMDEGSLGITPLDDWGSNEGMGNYIILSSDEEDSDGEILVTPLNDIDMPTVKKQFVTAEDALTATAKRFAVLRKGTRKYRNTYGFVTNLGLIIFLMLLLAFMDWCAWRIVRRPLNNFYFLSPFLASAGLTACAGYVSVPFLKRFDVRRKSKRKWPFRLYFKKGTPTVGGLFFIPVGVAIAKLMSGSSRAVSGTIAVTLAFSAVGLLDDVLGHMKYHDLSKRIRILLKVAVAAWFSFWLCTKNISSPYGMKMLVPLPAPFGLVNLGKCYLLLTSFTFIFMANGHNIIDCLDGLAGGTSALAFVGMSIAVLPICSELAIFGTSMAGACVGFLLHNRYKASVCMGNTGSMALAGALAAMASCTGMFFPLFIASGIEVLEVLAMTTQILYYKITERFQGDGRYLFPVAPLHYHLELFGIQESFIVTGAFVISSFLAVLAGYVGLISA